jgi:hypothetical protein
MALLGTLVTGLVIGSIIFLAFCIFRKKFPRYYAYKCFENQPWSPKFENSK